MLQPGTLGLGGGLPHLGGVASSVAHLRVNGIVGGYRLVGRRLRNHGALVSGMILFDVVLVRLGC